MNSASIFSVKRAVPSVLKQPRTFTNRVLQRTLCLILAVLTLAFSGSAAMAKVGKPLPGTPVGLEGDPRGVIVARDVTDKNGKMVFRDLKPGDYYASAAISTSRSNIRRPGVVTVIMFSVGGEPVWANVSNAKAVKILFTVPQGKQQSVTITLTEGDGKNQADAAPPK